jgi:ABC-type antimicrobial peptide transport system permease subunit
MYKLNFIAIVSIVAAVTLIVGLAAPALAQQNMTAMDNITMADDGSTMMNSNSTIILPHNLTR